MSRFAVILFMLFALVWQSTAMARLGSSVNLLGDLQHAALHYLEAAHLHLEDGSYELDESNESVQHVLTDHTSTSTALLAADNTVVLPAGSTSPDDRRQARAPNPTLDGLLRPPRLHA